MRLVLIAGLLAGCAPRLPAPSPRTAASPIAQSPIAPRLEPARSLFPDARTLWARGIAPTCSPNGGVCHNNRQLPDLQTFSGFLSTISQRCNLLREDPATLDNLCEPPGDLLVVGPPPRTDGPSFTTHLGHVKQEGEGGPLTVTLRDPLPDNTDGRVTIERRRPGEPPLVLDVPHDVIRRITPGERVIVLDAAALQRRPAPGGNLATFLRPATFRPFATLGIELGDPNRDGVFGHDLKGALVVPGEPSRSYLLLRVLSPMALGEGHVLTNRKATPSVQAQMPIANFEHWDGEPAMLALACWISGLNKGEKPDGEIDYARCDPNAVPVAVDPRARHASFTRIYQTVLSPRCFGPCHHPGGDPETKFHLSAEVLESWGLLVGDVRGLRPSQSELPYVTRGDPARSYLYLKLTEHQPPKGERMPPSRPLSDEELAMVRDWILQGAGHD